MGSHIYMSLHFPVIYHLERDTKELPVMKKKPLLLPSLIAQRLFWNAMAAYCNSKPDDDGIYSFSFAEFKKHYSKAMSNTRILDAIDEIQKVEIVSEDGERYYAFGDEKNGSEKERKKSIWIRPSASGAVASGDVCFTSQFFEAENMLFKAVELTEEEIEQNCVVVDYDFLKDLPGNRQNHIVALYPIFMTMKKALDANPHGIAFMPAKNVLLNGGYQIEAYSFAQYKSFCFKPALDALNELFNYDMYADEIKVYKGREQLDLVAFHETKWSSDHIQAITQALVPDNSVE